MPTKILQFKTPLSMFKICFPFSRLHTDLPLKIFGSIAFVHIHDQNRDKLDPRVKKCVFVRYSPTKKDTNVLNLFPKKMCIDMDTTFFEYKPFFDSHLQGENKDNEDLDNSDVIF